MSDLLPPSGPRQREALRAVIERIHDHCADTRSLFLRMTAGAMPRFIPGMFISITIPLTGETRVRPYTIASSPEDGEPFEICFNRVPGGPGAAWLLDRAVGDELGFTGPFGTFTMDGPPVAETILIAEGTAIAPIRPILRRALSGGAVKPIKLLYAADRREHLLYADEFERLAAARAEFQFEPMIVAGESAVFHERLLAEVRRRWVNADADRGRHFYICGIGGGVLALRDLLRASGYERRSVHYEKW